MGDPARGHSRNLRGCIPQALPPKAPGRLRGTPRSLRKDASEITRDFQGHQTTFSESRPSRGPLGPLAKLRLQPRPAG
eukprot:5737480-Alexandrium_andersonii.AAC.1